MQEKNEEKENVKNDVVKEDVETDSKKVLLVLMEKTKAENAELLAKIEKRNAEFKALVDEAKMAGRGSAEAEEKTGEEKEIEEAKKLIAGTGLERHCKL